LVSSVFWLFTGVLQEIPREVTRKVGNTTDGSLSNRQIQITVIVKVSPTGSMTVSRGINPRVWTNIRKGSIPVISVKIRGPPPLIINKEVEITFVIEITPDRFSKRESRRIEPRRDGDISKDWGAIRESKDGDTLVKSRRGRLHHQRQVDRHAQKQQRYKRKTRCWRSVHGGVGVGVGTGVGVGVSVGFGVGVALGLGVGVSVGFGVAVALGLGVGVSVGLEVAVALGLGVGVSVGLGVGVSVDVGVGVGVSVGGRTVKVALLLVALPALLLTTTEKRLPLSASTVAGVV
jgi:hypothetical protein